MLLNPRPVFLFLPPSFHVKADPHYMGQAQISTTWGHGCINYLSGWAWPFMEYIYNKQTYVTGQNKTSVTADIYWGNNILSKVYMCIFYVK